MGGTFVLREINKKTIFVPGRIPTAEAVELLEKGLASPSRLFHETFGTIRLPTDLWGNAPIMGKDGFRAPIIPADPRLGHLCLLMGPQLSHGVNFLALISGVIFIIWALTWNLVWLSLRSGDNLPLKVRHILLMWFAGLISFPLTLSLISNIRFEADYLYLLWS